jgi:hypothetical protein
MLGSLKRGKDAAHIALSGGDLKPPRTKQAGLLFKTVEVDVSLEPSGTIA